jgi:hypothetical protein
MNILNKTAQIKLLAGFSGLILAAGLQADTFVRESSTEFSVQPDQTLTIDVGSGEVEVVPGGPDKVVITLLMSVKAPNEDKAEEIFENTLVEMSKSPDEIFVKTGIAKKEARSWFGLKSPKLPKIKVLATCPPDFDLSLDTGSGDIHVEGITGRISLDTGSGNIHGANLGGSVYADTGSGDIAIRDLMGDLVADTGSGNVEAHGLQGELYADTGSGNISATGAITRFSADTGSGSVDVSTSRNLLENSKADTGSGSVRIQLPANATFGFSAQTRSGSIECAFPNAVYSKQEKRHLKGSVGSEGPKLVLDAGSGNVAIRPVP